MAPIGKHTAAAHELSISVYDILNAHVHQAPIRTPVSLRPSEAPMVRGVAPGRCISMAGMPEAKAGMDLTSWAMAAFPTSGCCARCGRRPAGRGTPGTLFQHRESNWPILCAGARSLRLCHRNDLLRRTKAGPIEIVAVVPPGRRSRLRDDSPSSFWRSHASWVRSGAEAELQVHEAIVAALGKPAGRATCLSSPSAARFGPVNWIRSFRVVQRVALTLCQWRAEPSSTVCKKKSAVSAVTR